MKIIIEFKDKQYTVTYEKFKSTKATVAEAVDDIVKQFSDRLKQVFLTKPHGTNS